MKTPHSPGSHPMLWTVVAITLGHKQNHDSPTRQSPGGFHGKC